jgi:TatD DNase family protein
VPAALVDTHFHLDLFPNPGAVAARCEAKRIYTIAVTNAPCVFEKTERLTTGMKYVRAALGLHPELAVQRRGELSMFRDLLPRTRYVGEIGLDYSTSSSEERRVQRSIFEEIVGACSEAGDKVLTIHSRRAADDVVGVIGGSFRGTAILHWYSGSLQALDRAVAGGAYFSLNTAMCLGPRFTSLLARIPRERILTETDGPFVDVHGRKAEPGDVHVVLSTLASTWSVSMEDVKQMVYANFARALQEPRNLGEGSFVGIRGAAEPQLRASLSTA